MLYELEENSEELFEWEVATKLLLGCLDKVGCFLHSSLAFYFSTLDPFQETLYSLVKVGLKSIDPHSPSDSTSLGEMTSLWEDSDCVVSFSGVWESLEGTRVSKEIDIFEDVGVLERDLK